MMPIRITGPSLCTNCVHRGRCVFERTAAGPVQHCDEHLVIAPAQSAVPSVAPVVNDFVPTGLCVTCDHGTTCALRSPDRIVLHCEHYE
jgi:hypothetical protein